MSNAVAGPGWLLQHSTHGAGVFTTLTEVRDINGPPQVLEKDEVTNQSSANFYKEWITTLLDGGDVTFTSNYVPGDAMQNSATGLLSYLQGRGLQDFQIVPPSPNAAHTISFSAYVTKHDSKFPVGKAATIDTILTVTGPVSVL